MSYRVAVVGATGAVGREMMTTLEEVNFPIKDIYAVASRKSVGIEISFGNRTLKCVDLETFDFTKVDIVLMSAGGDVSKAWSEKIGKLGPIVIDNSSAWRMDPDVPLIVPEVNPDAIWDCKKKNIIANPNCSTIQMVVALKPLHDAATVKRVIVSTYQATAGAGKEGMDELWDQTKAVYGMGEKAPKKFTKEIAFNVIPHIDVFMEDGQTKEEWKMKVETKKILDPNIEVFATCVRVPVFVGHSESINVEFENPLDEDEAREILREAPGIAVVDKRENGGYVTPKECVGEFDTFISRLRKDPSVKNGLAFWCVSDNLRKGAALNAVQIAQLLDERGVLTPVDA
ncbi:aspartate-semialdehyde dehydrogenase [Asticcacaulis machinosus]|uniref:Aspartate-semialdehyde dehydrogenase n=1 Tax=Asticcacaulis machinosus TaxID=2984211 RepID=A0ABT5HJP7_9CAUL|nr:aspartate-semialdehyde dehydrogenase [Asticcacaulis machinosus]MDC7676422.1 aspartate-semialdehyde dehydrogenase [Asticcacaulis machinosus]